MATPDPDSDPRSKLQPPEQTWQTTNLLLVLHCCRGNNLSSYMEYEFTLKTANSYSGDGSTCRKIAQAKLNGEEEQ